MNMAKEKEDARSDQSGEATADPRAGDRCGAYAKQFPPGCQLAVGHDGDHRGGPVQTAQPGWEDVDGENADYVNRITAVVRESDRMFTDMGGTSRHWVRDVFLPLLNRSGLFIAHHVEKCRHCGEDIRQDANGDWMDRETFTVCDSETEPAPHHHQPELRAGTVQALSHHSAPPSASAAQTDVPVSEKE